MYTRCDFHIHSTVSDGSSTIAQLIKKAEQKGLDAIAITDHDTLSHAKQIPAIPQVVAGIEISAVHKPSGTAAHILGYNIAQPEIVTKLVQPVLEERNRISEKQAKIIAELGYDIPLNKLARGDGKYLYKQHIMAWLCETGQVEDMFGKFYKQIFKGNGPCNISIEYPSVFDAVKTIKDAGGLAVLAHPGQQANFWLIPELCKLGLDGLELNHPSNSKNDKKIIKEYVKEYNLFLTGGSDYHGKHSNHSYDIGDMLCEPCGIDAILGGLSS